MKVHVRFTNDLHGYALSQRTGTVSTCVLRNYQRHSQTHILHTHSSNDAEKKAEIKSKLLKTIKRRMRELLIEQQASDSSTSEHTLVSKS